MAVVVSCPNCKGRGNVPETTLGKKIKCRRCEQVFTAIADGDTNKMTGPSAPPPPTASPPKEGEYHDDMPL